MVLPPDMHMWRTPVSHAPPPPPKPSAVLTLQQQQRGVDAQGRCTSSCSQLRQLRWACRHASTRTTSQPASLLLLLLHTLPLGLLQLLHTPQCWRRWCSSCIRRCGRRRGRGCWRHGRQRQGQGRSCTRARCAQEGAHDRLLRPLQGWNHMPCGARGGGAEGRKGGGGRWGCMRLKIGENSRGVRTMQHSTRQQGTDGADGLAPPEPGAGAGAGAQGKGLGVAGAGLPPRSTCWPASRTLWCVTAVTGD